MHNGLRFGLSFEEYSKFPGLNQTSLKKYLHLQDRSSSFKINQRALIRGNAGHCLILETDRFHQTYVPAPQGLRFRGELGKKRWKAFEDQHPGKTVLPRNLWDQLMASARVIAVHPKVSSWMEEGYGEASVFWQDPEFQLSCKARLDWYNPSRNMVLDFKFSNNGNESYCRKQMKQNHYDLQGAWYCRGIAQVQGSFPDYVLIFVESVKPHRIQEFIFSREEIMEGESKIQKALNIMNKKNNAEG